MTKTAIDWKKIIEENYSVIRDEIVLMELALHGKSNNYNMALAIDKKGRPYTWAYIGTMPVSDALYHGEELLIMHDCGWCDMGVEDASLQEDAENTLEQRLREIK